ncbi:hypothetical protein Ancab_008926 [Ancistrocladus abbreviatus]
MQEGVQNVIGQVYLHNVSYLKLTLKQALQSRCTICGSLFSKSIPLCSAPSFFLQPTLRLNRHHFQVLVSPFLSASCSISNTLVLVWPWL